MKWHKGNTLPNIETETALCVVQYKYPVNEDENIYETYYEVLLFHKDTRSFSEPRDVSGVYGLKEEFIIRWAYIEENDDVYQEQDALTAIYAAIAHVRSLFGFLLTDGMRCGKEYRDLVGLNELDALQEKVSKRISYLDSLE
jgi:hypothetical protein